MLNPSSASGCAGSISAAPATRNRARSSPASRIPFATNRANSVRGVAGAYYFHDSGSFDVNAFIADLNPFTHASNPDPNIVNDLDTKATALFGQGTFDLTSTVRLVAGARYSKEKKTVEGTDHIVRAPVTGSLDVSRVSWKLGVEADVAPDSLAYATVETGFKAGGFFAAEAPNTFKPEYLTAFTLGSKNAFLSNRLQFNGEAFLWKYKDKQVSHLAEVNDAYGTSTPLITQNAGKATLSGLELELRFLLTPLDNISATALYEHTKYDSYVVTGVFNNGGPPATTCPATPEIPAGSGKFVVDCSGNELAQAPAWSGTFGYSHTVNLPASATLVFVGAAIVKSDYWVGEEHLTGQKQSGFVTGDVSLTYNAEGNRWSVGGFVDNVSNRAVALNGFVQPLFARPIVSLGPPRTYGARLNYRF